MWYERKKKFVEGVQVIAKNLSPDQLEGNLRTIQERFEDFDGDLSLLAQLETDLSANLTPQDVLLVHRTLFYVVQRLKLFLMSPVKLQNDLTDLGFNTDQAEKIVKVYSESTRSLVKDLRMDESEENEVVCTIKTTLFDDVSLRCKKPVARLSLNTNSQQLTLDNLNRSELSKLFDKFENIQKELDLLAVKTNK